MHKPFGEWLVIIFESFSSNVPSRSQHMTVRPDLFDRSAIAEAWNVAILRRAMLAAPGMVPACLLAQSLMANPPFNMSDCGGATSSPLIPARKSQCRRACRGARG